MFVAPKPFHESLSVLVAHPYGAFQSHRSVARGCVIMPRLRHHCEGRIKLLLSHGVQLDEGTGHLILWFGLVEGQDQLDSLDKGLSRFRGHRGLDRGLYREIVPKDWTRGVDEWLDKRLDKRLDTARQGVRERVK